VGRSVVIVGGGVAGLACAWETVRRGGDPLVLEASARAGGWVRTENVEGALVELGPQGFLGESPGVLDVVDDLGLRDALLPAADAAATRYLLHRGKLVALPASPPAFLSSPLLPLPAKLRVLAEPWAKGPPGGPETIHEFAARRIGKRAAEVLVDAAVTGIFAGDPKALSVDACFPKMTRMERDHGGLFKAMKARKKAGGGDAFGKRLHSFAGGMEDLIGALTRELGDRVRLQAPVTAIARNGAGWTVTAGGERHEAAGVVMAAPAAAAAELLKDAAPGVAALAAEIPSAAVGVIGMTFRRDSVRHPLDGYGYLVPGGRHPILGCLFESTVFPNRAPDGMVLLRAMAGGARNPGAVSRPASEIAQTTFAAIRDTLGIEGAPVSVKVAVHRNAIPQYDRAHPERLRRAEAELAKAPGLLLAGASWRGVSVNHLVGEAGNLAEQALERR
jgi:oxygen-dependent protoporphyrinogen oxidase